MKTVVRNFFSVLRRFKLASLLNVLGLSVAFAAFIVIMIQVRYEQNFDRCHPKAERIFRMDLNSEWGAIHSRAFADAVIHSSPHIQAGTIVNPFAGKIYVTVSEGNAKKGFRETFHTCYPEITRIFGFRFVEGEAGCLKDPEKVIIPASMAKRMFGDAPAVGKLIHAEEAIWTKDLSDLTIGGVYEDFPGNTQVDNVIYTSIDQTMVSDWGSSNFICYLLLDRKENASLFVEQFNKTFDFSHLYNPEGRKFALSLVPLTDIHFHSAIMSDLFKIDNPNTIKILTLIAFLVIIIAGINFTNFNTALSPIRVRSINTQKVLGSSAGMLRRALVFEAVVISLFSWLVASGMIWLLDYSRLLSFLEAGVNLSDNYPIVIGTALLSILVGIIAGLYPAYYVTSFPPALALKGNFALSPSGRKLRSVLIASQYIISFGLILSAAFIQLQNNYIRQYNQGFDKDRIVIVELNKKIYKNSKTYYVNKLKEYSGIEDVAFSRLKLGGSDIYTTYEFRNKEKQTACFTVDVSPNFLKVMGIPVQEGRDFTLADERDSTIAPFILNRSVQRQLQMDVNGSLGDWKGGTTAKVVGFTGDVKISSLREKEDPIAFVLNSTSSLPVSYIRLKAGVNMHEAIRSIHRVVSGIDPSYPFTVELYNNLFDQLYHKEVYLNRMITLFSLLAIFISIIGVFGLVVFETQYRKKEIGIRKVHGATAREILVMFNRTYFRILVICFVIAAPIALVVIRHWLENFAYKTPLYAWVFVLVFLAVAVLTAATVSFQSWRAANENPVKSIKTE